MMKKGKEKLDPVVSKSCSELLQKAASCLHCGQKKIAEITLNLLTDLLRDLCGHAPFYTRSLFPTSAAPGWDGPSGWVTGGVAVGFILLVTQPFNSSLSRPQQVL